MSAIEWAPPALLGVGARDVPPRWILRLPGVYRPQEDSRLLAEVLAQEQHIGVGSKVLELCCGTGVLSLCAAARGAQVTAVDVSRRAIASTWLNTRLRRMNVRTIHARWPHPRVRGRFDAVIANPPYVPRPPGSGDGTPDDKWDAGLDGRALINVICDNVHTLLTPHGTALMVHSALCGTEQTLERLRRTGMEAAVVARQHIDFGPVMRARTAQFTAMGLIAPGQQQEELVVIRAQRQSAA